MLRLTNRHITAGLGSALGFLLAIGVASLIGIRQGREANRQVVRGLNALLHAEAVLSRLQDAETGQRGYLLTGDGAYLEPYDRALNTLDAELAALRQFTAKSQAQQDRGRRVLALSHQKLGELARTIRLRREAGLAAALPVVRTNHGQRLMSGIRTLIRQIESEERRLLEERSVQLTHIRTQIAVTILGGSLILFVWIGLLTVIILADITERDRSERAEREQRERLEVTLESIGDAVIVTDDGGRVMRLNPHAEALTGWRHEEAIGKALEDVFHIEDEETRRSVENPVLRVLREGAVIGLANHTCLIARDGRARAIDDSAAPIRDAEGRIEGVILVFRDITARREAEGRERENEERLRLAVDAGRVGIWDWDIPRDSITWSDRVYEIHGLAPGSFSGRLADYRRLIHEGDAEHMAEAIQRALGERQPFIAEARIVRPGGEVRWIWTSARVVYDNQGQPVRMIGATLDITDRKAAEEVLREADRQKDQFMAILAHELRNPLSAINNAVRLLHLAGPSEPQLDRAREIIERQVRHQTRLLEDLLNVTRIAHGKIDLQMVPQDFGQLVEETVADSLSAFCAAGVTLRLVRSSEPVWVLGDAARLVQAFGNLLQNAQRYTDAGGEVVVSVGPDAERPVVVLRVKDTGIGIDSGLLPRVFEPFTQADQSLDRSRGGLGLGLAMVKGLVTLHGGDVTAHSEGRDRGAEFVVRLPLIEAPAAREEEASATFGRSAGRRILIIEDSPDGADSLREILELIGHEVEVAYTGPEGVEAARRFRPEVVLSDLGLPGMDGYAVAEALRRDPATSRARLILVTGYGREEDIARGHQAGFDAHLVKPVDFEDLERLLALPPGR